MRVIVTGAAGLLGAAIAEGFRHDADVHAANHRALDITNAAAVRRLVADARPEVIVNCAAFNDVDRAEGEPQLALSVNAFGVKALARAARDAGAAFVHYSSDFVFDGEAAVPYGEDDEPRPRSVYAASKLLGDWFAADAPRHYVLRVESLFGGPGSQSGARRGSLGTIVARIAAGEEVPVFVDRTVSPSFTPDIAQATRELLTRNAPPGLYHCVNTGAATWAEIATEAARLLQRDLRMRPLTLGTAALTAARPRYCALSNEKLRQAGILMPSWQDALARYLRLESLIPHP
jgi:dTDP-4-dehydrorhamnose reductase